MDLHSLKNEGWTNVEIAQELGYHPATVAKWLNADGPPDRAATDVERPDNRISELKHLQRKHEHDEQRASAALLLKDTFDKHRLQTRQGYVGPLRHAIDELGRKVYGPTFSVEISEDLQVVSRVHEGTALGVDQLSHGTREQIAVLSRLACAAIISPEDGGVPVIIDDALGWSDSQRLKTMCAAIEAAGKTCQVILLTCNPARYCHIESARVERV